MTKFSLKKAVFPVAGMGTRFLPATKASPKEMLPIVDKPLIQYAIEEAVKAGLTEMIFIINDNKQAIKQYFEPNHELEKKLLQQEKKELYDLLKSATPPNITFKYAHQKEPLGLGHAILCAKSLVGNEPFAILLADDLIDESTVPCLSEMANQYRQTGQSYVAVQPVPEKEVHKYGIVNIAPFQNNLSLIKGIIEKPAIHEAPSNFAAVGRYIFTPQLFNKLRNVSPDKMHEIQLTHAIADLIQHEPVNAFHFTGQRYDCGSKVGYVQAILAYALKHPEIARLLKEDMRQYL